MVCICINPPRMTPNSGLQRLGFHVKEVPVPVNVTAIKGTYLKEHIDKNGCSGAAKVIKLSSYRLTALNQNVDYQFRSE
jgi:hypothetical protein